MVRPALGGYPVVGGLGPSWCSWMPTGPNLSPTLPFTVHPHAPELFSCPLLPYMFVFLSMMSILRGHVVTLQRTTWSAELSVISQPHWRFLSFLTLHYLLSPEFVGWIIFPFPPVLCLYSLLPSLVSLSPPWRHFVLDVSRCGQWHLCEYHAASVCSASLLGYRRQMHLTDTALSLWKQHLVVFHTVVFESLKVYNSHRVYVDSMFMCTSDRCVSGLTNMFTVVGWGHSTVLRAFSSSTTSSLGLVCTRPEGANRTVDVWSAHLSCHQPHSCSLSPPTGASQADRECGEQGHVPAAHHLQRLQSSQVRGGGCGGVQ